MANLVRTAVGALLLAFLGGAANANLISNGGFETGDPDPIFDWTCVVSSSGVCRAATEAESLTPHSGLRLASVFDNDDVGSLSQTFGTMTGVDYSLSFWINTEAQDPGSNAFSYAVNGGTSIVLSPTFQTWTQITDTFTATAATSTLAFFFKTTPGNGSLYLDDVSVVAAPEPATLALCGLGLAGLGVVRRRKLAA